MEIDKNSGGDENFDQELSELLRFENEKSTREQMSELFFRIHKGDIYNKLQQKFTGIDLDEYAVRLMAQAGNRQVVDIDAEEAKKAFDAQIEHIINLLNSHLNPGYDLEYINRLKIKFASEARFHFKENADPLVYMLDIVGNQEGAMNVADLEDYEVHIANLQLNGISNQRELIYLHAEAIVQEELRSYVEDELVEIVGEKNVDAEIVDTTLNAGVFIAIGQWEQDNARDNLPEHREQRLYDMDRIYTDALVRKLITIADLDLETMKKVVNLRVRVSDLTKNIIDDLSGRKIN